MGWRESIGHSGLYKAISSDDVLKSCGKGGGNGWKEDVCMEGKKKEGKD